MNPEELCLELALKAKNLNEVPVGCVVVKNGLIISKAHNQVETLKDPTAHAEMIALKGAFKAAGSKYLTDCEVYVSLEPCPMCAWALALARVKKVVFLALDERRGGIISNWGLLDETSTKWEYKPIMLASSLISEFFKSLRV
ncbi:MAG: nucleoside deaminase [Aquificaceae bacterium]|nr:nucleoside deaminase [Aquificaceae bacterium]MDW8237291.1 nucleoside deaminase [Aquificaceae bacterium]